MSPRPRIGGLDERLAWFAEYGVRECWLVRPAIRQIEVISFVDRRTVDRRVFEQPDTIESTVLLEFEQTPASMLTTAW